MSTIDPIHLVYRGAFKLPADLRFPYGGEVIARAHDGLYVSGHVELQLMAKISIPEPKFGTLGMLNTAKLLSPFFDPTGGLRAYDMKLGGAYAPDKARLLFSVFKDYNVDGEARPSHGISFPPSSSAGLGLYRIGARILPHNLAGYICPIPQRLQAKFDFPFLTGRTNHPGQGNRAFASEGPCAFGYDPWMKGTVLPTKRFLWYNLDHPATYEYRGMQHKWKGANYTSGLAFPELLDGSSALIYFSRVGTYAEDWYGEAEDFPGEKPICGDGKGFHAPPYRVAAWFYDPEALINNIPKKRYATLDLTPHFYNECALLGGVASDYSGNIYVVERSADQKTEYDAWPVVHCFRVA